MTDKQQAVRDEVMSVMRERSVDSGYKSIRVGLKSICNEVCKDTNVSEIAVAQAVDWLLDKGYLIKNGQYTMDIGKGDYFADHQRDPEALKKEPEPEINEGPEKKQPQYVEQKPVQSDLTAALQKLETRLSPVSDKETKLQVLNQLARYMHPSIATVLDDIARVIDSMEAA